MKIFSPILKGTTTVAQGTTNLSGSFTGSLFGTAATASYADNFTVGGTLTAQTINVQIITSSIEFNTGSTRNGALSTNTHQFTGSVLMSGSVGIGTSSPVGKLDIAWGGYQTQGGAINIGADIGNLTTRTNNTIKYGIISAVPYTTSDKSIELLTYYSNNTEKVLSVGGGGNTDFAGLNSISFLTTSSLTQPGAVRMTITSAGNVGIGTSTPTSLLNINTSDATAYDSTSDDGQAANGATLTLRNGSTTASSFAQLNMQVSAESGRAEVRVVGICMASATSDMAFVTENANVKSEKMRITSAGELCVGTNTPSYNTTNRGNITINGAASSLLAFQVAGFAKAYAYHDGTNYSIVNNASGTIYMSSNGGGVQLTSGATSWASSSDERLKNINSNIENALLKLASLRTVNFSWKSDTTNKELLGLIAQDIEQVLPQVIDRNKLPTDINDEQTDETEYLSVRYTELIPVLVKAIQELKSENDTLKEILQRNNIQ
jgi:hypothetical protein